VKIKKLRFKGHHTFWQMGYGKELHYNPQNYSADKLKGFINIIPMGQHQ